MNPCQKMRLIDTVHTSMFAMKYIDAINSISKHVLFIAQCYTYNKPNYVDVVLIIFQENHMKGICSLKKDLTGDYLMHSFIFHIENKLKVR